MSPAVEAIVEVLGQALRAALATPEGQALLKRLEAELLSAALRASPGAVLDLIERFFASLPQAPHNPDPLLDPHNRP